MTEDSPSHKFHKALLQTLMGVSALIGGAKFTAYELQDAIKQTKEMIAEVKKPEIANGMTEQQWKQLQEQQHAFYDLSRAEAFRDKLTQPQRDEIDSLTAQLPWNSWYQSHFPSYGGVAPYYVVEKPGPIEFHNPKTLDPKLHERKSPLPLPTLDPKAPPPNTTTREVTIHEVTTREVTTHEITTQATTHETTTSSASPTDTKPTDTKPAAKQLEPAADDSSKDHSGFTEYRPPAKN